MSLDAEGRAASAGTGQSAPRGRGSTEPRRRVLLLCDEYWTAHGGTEGQIRALVANLPPGWGAELWVTSRSAWLEHNPFPCPTRSLRLGPLSRPWTFLRIRRLARLVRRRGFSLIQTFMIDASVLGPILGRAAGVPVLVSRRDLGFWQTPALLSALRCTGRWAAGFVANVEAVKRQVVEAEQIPPSDVAVVHNGHPFADLDGPRVAGLRAAHGIPADATVLVLVANVRPLKRHTDLVEAAARLVPRHPRLHVLLVGGGPQDDIRATAARVGMADRLTIHHAKGDAVDYLKEAAVGVLCSESEGLSNAILEYMACGLPVVATAVGGNLDLVADGVNGFLYEVGDVGGLASRLDRVLSDDALRERMGAASRERLRVGFGLGRMVSETVRVYERAIAGLPVGEAAQRAGESGGSGPEALSLSKGAEEPHQSHPLVWETIADVGRLAALADPWRALCGRNQFFSSPEWVLTWLAWSAGSAQPLALVARDAAGALVGLLPMARRGSTLALPGTSEGADHLDVVAARGRAAAVADGALDRLLAMPTASWSRLSLRHLSEDGALRYAVRRRRGRLPYREGFATVCPYVDATGTFDDYLKRFTAKHRGNLRRQARAFREDPAAQIVRVVDPAAAAEAVDVVLDLHDRRFASRGDPSAFSGPKIRALHRALAPLLAARGMLSLQILRVGGAPAAALYGFCFGGKVYFFQAGFDPALSSRSPGTALTTIVLEDDVFGAGLSEYDFLDGGEAYKTTFATGTRRLYDMTVARPTFVGRSATLLAGAASLVKSAARMRASRGTAPGGPSPRG